MKSYDFSHVRTLLVDDNAHMRHLVRSVLIAFGVTQVEEAGDGADALAILESTPIDLIITDLAMSPVDGLEFTRHVRRAEDGANPQAPIIMLTGHAERRFVADARDAGVSEVLCKPITAAALLSRICSVIERPRLFVRSASYVGPDRRRRQDPGYTGDLRRWDDIECEDAVAV